MMHELNPTQDFGSNPELYHRIRIGYPAAFIQSVFDKFDIRSNYTGAEIGSGSGQLTHVLVEGITVKPKLLYCIEPDTRAIAFSRQRFGPLPHIHYINKKFEDIILSGPAPDLPEGICDLIVAGDVGHWLEAETARKKICQLLKPEGRSIFFNRFIEREQDLIGKSLHTLLMQHCDFYRRLLETAPVNRYYNVIFEQESIYDRTQRDYKEWEKKELYYYLETHSPTMQWVKEHEADAYRFVIDPLFDAYGKNGRLTIPWKQTVLAGTLRRNDS